MNYGSKKTILKALLIWQIIIACVYIPSLILYLIFYAQLSTLFQNMYGISLPIDIISIVYFCVYLIYFCFFINYIPRKYKQTREKFHEKKIFFRIFSIVSIFLDLITGILLIITAFKKDDGKEEIVYIKPKKIKKTKVKLSKQTKSQINALKHQRRRGYISKEKYEKQLKEILKQDKTI